MGLLFSLRGDSLTPRYAMGGKEYTLFLEGGSLSNPPAPVISADPSCFGGLALSVGDPVNYRQILYPAKNNWVRGTKIFSLRVRAAPAVSGVPANDISPIRIGQLNQDTSYGGARLVWQDNNTLRIQAQPGKSLPDLFLNASPTLSLSAGVFKDYMLVSDGTNWFMSIEGVQVATGSVNEPTDPNYDLDWNTAGMIILGQYPFRGQINELTLWNTAEAHVYAPRTAWLACADFDGSTYTDPLEANVIAGTNYTFAGAAKAGTRQTVTNVIASASLSGQRSSGTLEVMIDITQGETVILNLTAEVDEDTPFDLTGAVFSTKIRGLENRVVTLADAAHAIVSAAAGTYTLTLTAANTQALEPGVGKEIVTTVTQGAGVKVFRAEILNVLPPFPQA